jgi:hypothetical protein
MLTNLIWCYLNTNKFNNNYNTIITYKTIIIQGKLQISNLIQVCSTNRCSLRKVWIIIRIKKGMFEMITKFRYITTIKIKKYWNKVSNANNFLLKIQTITDKK